MRQGTESLTIHGVIQRKEPLLRKFDTLDGGPVLDVCHPAMPFLPMAARTNWLANHFAMPIAGAGAVGHLTDIRPTVVDSRTVPAMMPPDY